MKQLLSGLFLAAALALPAPAALAAAPASFRAKGEVSSVTDGEAQNMRVTISFKGGKVRVETESKDIGKSIVVAHKGKDEVAMLDPDQKMVVKMRPSAMRGASQDDLTSFDTLLDPGGFKAVVTKQGKKVGPGEGILGHKTTIWERNSKQGKTRVWLADDLDLPLRVEGKAQNGDKFNLKVTAIDLKPTFGKDEFDDTPPGYTEVKAESEESPPAKGKTR